ncbi:hypothetical protein AWENTII_012559 [Aspergillus wentii]
MAADPDDNIAYRLWIGTIVTLVPATIAVIVRFIARFASRVGYWWDDYTIIVALIINWGMAATRWSEILVYDYGRHSQFLSTEKVQNFQKSFIAVQITYFANAVFTKASILLLYHRVFGVVNGFRWALAVSGAIITAYFISCVIVSIAGCSPVSYFWDRDQPGSCIDEVNFFRWNGIVNMLLDILVLCLPLPMTWRVKTNLRQKMILSGIFLLGGFVCIVSILRITAFRKSNPKDPTYTTVETAMWSSIEQSVGIICACLPTFRPLFRRLYGASQHSSNGKSTGTQRTPSTTIHLSDLGSRGGETGSTVGFARWPTEQTASTHEVPWREGHSHQNV